MDHGMLFILINFAFFFSGMALGVAIESWRRTRK